VTGVCVLEELAAIVAGSTVRAAGASWLGEGLEKAVGPTGVPGVVTGGATGVPGTVIPNNVWPLAIAIGTSETFGVVPQLESGFPGQEATIDGGQGIGPTGVPGAVIPLGFTFMNVDATGPTGLPGEVTCALAECVQISPVSAMGKAAKANQCCL
jgi:hypothetical protein